MMAPHSICAISAAPFHLSYLLLQLSISDYVQHIFESLQDHKLISFPLFSGIQLLPILSILMQFQALPSFSVLVLSAFLEIYAE